MSRLARSFEVVWIEPAAGWRDHWLPGGRTHPRLPPGVGAPQGLTVLRPGRWLPEIYRPRFLGRWLRMQRVRKARRMLLEKGCSTIVLHLWRPSYAWALGAIRPDFTCYHIDDEYRFSFERVPEDPEEQALIRAVDQVVITSPQLMERKGSLNPNTLFVPNGVDFSAFSTRASEPADLASIPRPRIGYVGVIQVQLDLGLMLVLAARHPEWSFVFVGPNGYLGEKADTLARLAALPNVHLLGKREPRELPGYVQHMDVSTMCYEVNDYTNCIFPLKLNEYLAAGGPVVSAPIRSVQPFSQVVYPAATAAQWEASLQHALSPQARSAQAREARQRVARKHDWDALVERIAAQFRNGVAAAAASGEVAIGDPH